MVYTLTGTILLHLGAMKKVSLLYICITMLLIASSCSNSNNTGDNAAGNMDTTQPSTGVAIGKSRGQDIFEQRCQACHGLNGDYRNNNAANLQKSRIDSISIINTIKNGKGAMPLFGHAIPDSDLAQVEMYVKSLR